MSPASKIMLMVNDIEPDLIRWRRDFHRHPELGFQEKRTASVVAATLEALGWQVRTGVGRTGVVAHKGQGQPCLALRADMDALPIRELNQSDYKSCQPGVMHACGHDAHTAMLLGVAKILATVEFTGSVRLLFQPSEEQDDDQGKSGAMRMIEDGAMDQVTAVAALHVSAEVPVGSIRLGEGNATAGSDTFRIRIRGKGGHAAYPHSLVNPIGITGHLIVACESTVSRCIHPDQPAVVNFGAIHGGEVDNVVPEEVTIIGTIRYRDKAVQKTIHAKLGQTMLLAKSLGGTAEINIQKGYPPTINDRGLTRLVREIGTDLLGPNACLPAKNNMGAEDFSYFADMAPGVMFWLGCQLEHDQRFGHNPYFDIDERCLKIGTALLAELALRYPLRDLSAP
ncbi:amidohydrolase [bacterium]|nr:amidohydrolase [bacterium]